MANDSEDTEPELPSMTGVSSLGAFSISLPVEDLATSIAFYEKLGFSALGGEEGSWMMLVNGTAVLGLFQGMFDKPMLTFNPGWGQNASELSEFIDVRVWRETLAKAGIAIDAEADSTGESDDGPASFIVVDPDGNPILIDQHR